ncbi:MAG: hypothetical protein KJT03_04145 [Verrucomicrobiae bacterium]|nr:hypothetical protein [Verrucomicrobiae bacterium]
MIRNPNYSPENFLVPEFKVSWPFYTVESDYLTAWICLIVAGVFVLLAYKKISIPGTWRKAILTGCAALSLFSYSNFFTFHGPMGDGKVRIYQTWDMFHYVIGARYQQELGYDHFYDACLLALNEIDEELEDAEFWRRFTYRDMRTYEILPASAAWLQREEIKDKFTTMRWDQFVEDIRFFYTDLSPEYFYNLLGDHGYNPPPTYSAVAKALTGTGDITYAKLRLLASIDWILLLLCFALIVWGFGLEAALICTTLFGVAYMSNFSWVGNAFLRFGWLVGVVGGMVFLKKEHPVLAGISLGLATGLRVFPGLLLFSLAFPFVWNWWKKVRSENREKASASAFGGFLSWRKSKTCVLLMKTVATAGVLLACWGTWTGFASSRPNLWSEWSNTISLHNGRLSANHVGLKVAVSTHPDLTSGKIMAADPIEYWNEKKTELLWKRAWIYFPLILIFLGLLLCNAGKLPPYQFLLLSLTGLFFFIDLSGYYYSFLALLPLTFFGFRRNGFRLDFIAAALLALVILGQYWTQQFYLHLDWIFAISSIVLLFIFLGLPLIRALLAEEANETTCAANDDPSIAIISNQRIRGK